MSNTTITETKVGLLVITAAAGLAWLTLQSGTIGGGFGQKETRLLESSFTNVDGITIGSKIKMAGVEIGEVSDIELLPDGVAILRLSIKEKYTLPANVKAQITSSGIIGEKFVALMTDFGAEGLLSNEVVRIPSAGSASVEDMAQNFAKVSSDLEQITSALRSALGGPDNAKQLTRIVDNLDKIGNRLDNILTNEIEPDKIKTIVDGLAKFSASLNNDGDVIVSDIKASMKSLRSILADNENQAGELISNLGIASKNLASITNRMERGEGTLGKLLHEDSTNMIDDLSLAAADFRQFTAKINNGEGTIGRLINDPGTADKIDNALDSIAGFGERMDAFRTNVYFQGYGLTAEGVSKGQFGVVLAPSPTRYYSLAITGDGFTHQAEDTRSTASYKGQDFGNSTKYTVQFGQVFQNAVLNQDLGFRIGVKDSTFGVGADMAVPIPYWDELVEVNADLYDFSGENSGNSSNVPHLDLMAKVPVINKNFYAIGGYDNALNQEFGSPFVGIGFRFQDDDLKFMLGQAL